MSPCLEYGKLLQSLHGKYEFVEQSDDTVIDGANMDLSLEPSQQYKDLYLALRDRMFMELTPEDVRSSYYHELVHWLRLIPYKIRKKPQSAPRHYAAFIIAMNDIYDMYEAGQD